MMPAAAKKTPAKRKPPRKKTGGSWDKTDHHKMFLPGSAPTPSFYDGIGDYHADFHPSILIAVNEIAESTAQRTVFEALIERDDVDILLDSGVFWLANGHARNHGMRMDEALGLAPDDLDNFDWLWTHYTAIVSEYGDRLWGYVELDQGGKTNKVKTRAKLNKLGMKPIPVWHPLVDGLDYGRELLANNDRICLGNIVQADTKTRTKLIATAWQLKQELKVDTWIHVLGLHGDEVLHAYPMESCDASTWLQGVRWGTFGCRADMHPFGKMPTSFIYPYAEQKGEDERSANLYLKLAKFGAYSVGMQQRGWHHHREAVKEALS